MKTLILNVNYDPLGIVTAQRAIVLMQKQYMRVVEYYDKELKSERLSLKVPAVMVYSNYIYRAFASRPAKRAVLARDKMICQYCERQLTNGEYSVDHIIPISRFKKREQANTWENMVACCKPCNYKKHNKTPEEAGMKLCQIPKKPRAYLVGGNVPKEWWNYI